MNVKNKKVIYTIIGIVAVILVTIAITYAYWLITKNQTGENVISSACLDISFTNEENDITLTNQFPLSDEDGAKLTPYTFTVTNNCNTSVDYHINLESIGIESEAVIPSAIKAMLDENTPQVLSDYSEKDITVEGAYEARLLGAGTLSAKDTEGSSATHSLRIWIDKNAPISEMNKTFRSKISVTIGQGIVNANPLSSLILADAQANNYLYSTTPDFSKVIEDGEYGLYTAPDDYGTSYYFRGDVENNYVVFGTYNEDTTITAYDNFNMIEKKVEVEAGSPMYWRIVRINGDKSIRLIYDGIELVKNGVSHTATIGVTEYNPQNKDSKYVGYTYDDGNGNQVDSTIKRVVDAWYTNNLEQNYSKYIADSIFCNDREVTSTSGPIQYFASFERIAQNKPVLTCTKQNDRYTVEDTEKGNGLLTNPVGLITTDEYHLIADSDISINKSYLANSKEDFWTISPSQIDNGDPIAKYIFDGQVNSQAIVSAGGIGARPVINLKSDILFTGSGTITDPYVIGE